MGWKTVNFSLIQSKTQNKNPINPNKATKTQSKSSGLIGFAVLAGLDAHY